MKLVREISFNEVAAEFLATEWYEPMFNSVRAVYDPIVTNPDLTDPGHLQVIHWLLKQRRGVLLDRVPSGTKWFLVELGDGEFDDLLIIREKGWEATFGARKTMRDVAMAVAGDEVQDVGGVGFQKIRAIKDAIGIFPFNEKLIAITRNLGGPHTIIEGNHRGVAFSMNGYMVKNTHHLPSQIILGVLPEGSECIWLYYLVEG